MKKTIILAAIAALTLALPQVGHAQTATTTAGSTSGAGATAMVGGSMGIGTLVVPGYQNGGGVQTVWTLGIAPPVSSVSYDACLKNFGISAIAGGISIPLEISHCWELRDMEAMAKFPPGSIQYEHGCRDSSWLNTDWVSGQMRCTANQAKLRKTSPNDPRVQAYVAVPVVQGGMVSSTVPSAPPPTVVPVSGTNKSVSQAPAAVDYSRKCNRALGITDQCTG